MLLDSSLNNQDKVTNEWLWFLGQDINDKLLFDLQIEQIRNQVLRLIPGINSAREIDDLKKPILSMISMWIPVVNFINDEQKQKIINFFSSLESWDKEQLTWWPVKTIEALLSLDNDRFEKILSRGVSNDTRIGILQSKNSISEILELLKEDIEIVVWSILDKVMSIIEYNTVKIKSEYDNMTGLLNKDAINSYWKDQFEIAESNPEKNPLSLIALDIDRFKSINDWYWHPIWDLVLREISLKLKNVSGEIKIEKSKTKSWRNWGEEFLIIMPNTSWDNALKIAEIVSRELWIIDLREQNTGVSYEITASIWIATFNQKWLYTDLSSLIQDADMRSYMAKRAWRNRIVNKWSVLDEKKWSKGDLILNMDPENIDYNKVLNNLSDKLQRFIATLVVQKQKIENNWDKKWEPISSLWPIDWTYRQVAYLMNYIFQTKWYGDFEWLKEPLAIFIWDNWNRVWIDGRFLDVDYFIEKWKLGDFKNAIESNPIENRCSSLHDFMGMIS